MRRNIYGCWTEKFSLTSTTCCNQSPSWIKQSIYQLNLVGFKVLKRTASKSMIAPGFLLAIPFSRIDVFFLLLEHVACPLKPSVGRLSVQIVLRRQIVPSDNPWHEESVFSLLTLVFEVPNPLDVIFPSLFLSPFPSRDGGSAAQNFPRTRTSEPARRLIFKFSIAFCSRYAMQKTFIKGSSIWNWCKLAV